MKRRAMKLRSIFLIFLPLWLMANVTSAGEPFSDQLVQAPKLATPKRGSLKGDFADLGEKALDLSTGSFSLSLPLSFPSDRGSMQNAFSVSYSPSFGLSEYGLGWNSRLVAKRSREIGQIDFQNDDLSTPFGQLVLGSDGYYYSKDLKQKIRAVLNGKVLTVYLPNGNVAIFGDLSSSLYNEIHENAAVSSWYLKSVSDQVGNQTSYTYQRLAEAGKLYLMTIEYGGLGTDYQYQIAFDYELTHKPMIDFSLGRELVANQRVGKIRFLSKESSGFEERYRYDFNYINGEESPAFYLSSIQKSYEGGGTEPAITFNYDKPKDYLAASQWQQESSLDTLASTYKGLLTLYAQTSTVDFNLDGRTDLEIGPGYKRYLNTESGFIDYNLPAPSGATGQRCLFPQEQSRKPRQFMQFLGAGTDQLAYVHYENNYQGALEICQVNGELLQTIFLPQFWQEKRTTVFHDIDKDSLPDIIHLSGNAIEVMQNTSSGEVVSFSAPSSRSYLALPSTYHSFWIRDLNGDGEDDLVLKGDSTIYLHYGIAGGGFSTNYVTFDFYLPNGSLNSKNLQDAQVIFVDANKDGLLDILLQGEGFITLHLNTGTYFVQIYIPGLFVNPQFYQNLVVADLGGTGGMQLASAVRDGGSNYVLTLDLDRPSLGLLISVDDGKGNETIFGFGKTSAQEGIQNLKTVVTKMTRKSSGEGDLERTYGYSQIAAHNLTKNFLGFQEVEASTSGQGVAKTLFSYDARNLQKQDESFSYDVNRPDVVRFSENTYSDITRAGITAPFMTGMVDGFRNASGTVSTSKTTSMVINSSTLCESSKTITSSSLNQSVSSTYDSLTAFDNHLACLLKDQTISATGTNSYSHELHLTRDTKGRVTQVKQGSSVVQDMTYGSNGRLASIDQAATGTTSVIYDSHYRLQKITNPDTTVQEITEFEFLNDQPKAIKLQRDSESFFSYFRYDGFGRLNKQWDDLGGYSEATPQASYTYQFATSTKPAKIFQTANIEKTTGSFGQSESLFLETARGQELATLLETTSYYKVTGLKAFDNQSLITEVFQNHLISSSTDLDALANADLDDQQGVLNKEEKDFIGGLFKVTSAVQSGTNKVSDVTPVIIAGGLETETILNSNGNQVTSNITNEFGAVTQYTDEAGSDYSYSRDSLGRIRKITFPDGIEQTVSYESTYGKIAEISRDHIGKVIYTYSSVTGLLIKKEYKDKNDLRQRTVDFTYDSIGRVSERILRSYDSGGSVTGTITHDYAYDGDNLDPADQDGQTGFLTGTGDSISYYKEMIYRLDGKPLKVETTSAGKRFEQTLDYFSQGDLKSKRQKVINDSNSNVEVDYELTYEYDHLGNIAKIKKGGSSFLDLTYNDFNELATATVSGGKELSFTYETLTRKLKEYKEEESSVTKFKQAMSWNNRGLISSSDFELSAGRTIDNSYTYNDRGFLSNQAQTDSGGTGDSRSFTYGASGAAYYASLTGYAINGGTTKALTIGSSSWTIDGTTYSLDTLGRVSSKGSKNFVYGPHGRIKEAKSGATSLAAYYYDEEDNPILKIEAGGAKEVYLGDNIWAGGDFYEPVQIGGRTIGYFKDGVFTASSQDHLSSYLLDESGTYNWASPFGDRSSRSAEVSKVLDYTLKGYDSDIAAVRMGRRYYDPVAKRFLRPDLYFLEGPEKVVGSPAEGHLYGYAKNNPVNFNDPSGEFVPLLLVGAAVGASLDVAAQVFIGGTELKDIDWVSVGASAATGAVGFGVASVTQNIAKAGVKAAINIGSNAIAGYTSTKVQNKITGKENSAATSGIISGVASAIGGPATVATKKILTAGAKKLNSALANKAYNSASQSARKLLGGGSIEAANTSGKSIQGVSNAIGTTLGNSSVIQETIDLRLD